MTNWRFAAALRTELRASLDPARCIAMNVGRPQFAGGARPRAWLAALAVFSLPGCGGKALDEGGDAAPPADGGATGVVTMDASSETTSREPVVDAAAGIDATAATEDATADAPVERRDVSAGDGSPLPCTTDQDCPSGQCCYDTDVGGACGSITCDCPSYVVTNFCK
jgi:hypothetical protein